MHETTVRERVDRHLRVLVDGIGARPPGSPANRRATDHVARTLRSAGLRVTEHPFTTRWWQPGDGRLALPDEMVPVAPNPFGVADVRGRVVRLERREDLVDDPALRGAVVVLGPLLAGDTVMPKAFPFFNPPEHRELVAFLERHGPAAVVGVSDRHASTPTFEDADLTFPSTTVPPAVGDRLTPGLSVRLELRGTVRSGDGVTVAARAGSGGDGGDGGPRVVVSAHVDSKVTTPGAFDNAGGVAVLLALAEAGLAGVGPVELVFFNGEDHWDACGERAWLAATDLADVGTAVNLDGAGVAGRGTTVTTLACPPAVDRRLDDLVAARPGWSWTDPWYESDHAIFALRGIPVVAVTSAGVHDLLADLAHTPADTRDVVDTGILADVVGFLRDWLTVVHRERLLATAPPAPPGTHVPGGAS